MKLFLIGGFLGSGKTTAIRQACGLLSKQGISAAVITNDQGKDLVDTGYLRNAGISTREVPNGCFCCNFAQLAEAILHLAEHEKPAVIFGESVGSCTDLVATVAKPLGRFQPDTETVITVFVDACLLAGIAGGNASFVRDEVRYIFKKQLEEADILIVNKTDLLDEAAMKLVAERMAGDYPRKTILFQNSLRNEDVAHWLETLSQFKPGRPRESLEIDYDTYAAGEARMAWLDQMMTIETKDASAVGSAAQLINTIITFISKRNYFIGHVKFFIDDGDRQEKISFTAAGSHAAVELPGYLPQYTIRLLLNARVQAEPAQLSMLVKDALDAVAKKTGCRIRVSQAASFQPGYPKPTHRFTE